MPFRVLCPTCSVKIKSPRKWAGKLFTCPQCKNPMRLPELADADVYPFVPAVANAPAEAAETLEPIILDEPENVPPPPAPPAVAVRAPAVPPVAPPPVEMATVAAEPVPPPPAADVKDDYDELSLPSPKREAKKTGKSRRVILVLALAFAGLAVVLPIVGYFGWSFLSTESKQFVRDMTRLGGPWKLYEPPDGSFVAGFPKLPPDSYSVSPSDPPFVDTKPETIAALRKPKWMGHVVSSDAKGQYHVGYQSFAGNRNDPETLDSVASARPIWRFQLKEGEEVIGTEPVTVAGHPGRRVLVRKGPLVVDARYTVVKDRTFLIAVHAKEEEIGSSHFESFFRHFRIKDFTPYPNPPAPIPTFTPSPVPNAKAAVPPPSKAK